MQNSINYRDLLQKALINDIEEKVKVKDSFKTTFGNINQIGFSQQKNYHVFMAILQGKIKQNVSKSAS